MAQTLSKIQVEVEAEALLDLWSKKLEQFEANTFCETVADVGDEALVNKIHYSLAEMEVETSGDTV